MDLVMEDLAGDGSEPIYSPLHYAGKTLSFVSRTAIRVTEKRFIRSSTANTPATAART